MYSSLFDIWKYSAQKFPNNIALQNKDSSIQITYKIAFEEICFLANFYNLKGLQKNDKICIFAENNPHWLLIEQAAITLGAISVAKNSNNNIEELEYVFYNSDSIALVSDKMEIINHFLAKDNDFCNKTKFIIYTGNEEITNSKIISFNNILEEFNKSSEIFTDYSNNPQDVCYIHYTSGTSSAPKGAILVNEGMYYQVEEIQSFLKGIFPKKFIVTFPLASAGGKCFNLFVISMGGTLIYAPYKDFYDLLLEIKPDFLHCAPKIMLTLYQKYINLIKQKGFIFNLCYKVNESIAFFLIKQQRKIYSKKETNVETKGFSKFIENGLDFLRKVQDKIIFKKIRNMYLRDDVLIAVGSASLAKNIEDFYNIIGVNLVQHYGMTETTGLTTHATIQDQKERPYTVGKFFSKTKFKIVNPETNEELGPNETGLLMIKGPEVLKGYYNNEDATKKALTPDGWLITGDLAQYSKDKYITILSRYDDVIVLMNGYNVYTPLLQNQANSSIYIKQTVIVGQGKPYLAAIAVLDKEKYNSWCNDNNIKEENPNKNEKFISFLIAEVNKLISQKEHFHYFEKIKKIYFLEEPFSVENGFLTNTLKMKYKKICKTYQKEIENLYEEY